MEASKMLANLKYRLKGDIATPRLVTGRNLQRIPVKLTHSQHVESSCDILHEKVSE
jgi:hypothetical protein